MIMSEMFAKKHFRVLKLLVCCCSHIYHYYLHGPVGNRPTDEQQPSADAILNIAVSISY